MLEHFPPSDDRTAPSRAAQYLVRPGPDPKRRDEMAWLTHERIEEEALRLSFSWTGVGSGRHQLCLNCSP